MLRQPVAVITEPVAGPRQRDGLGDRLRGGVAPRRSGDWSRTDRSIAYRPFVQAVRVPLTQKAQPVATPIKKPTVSSLPNIATVPKNLPQGAAGLITLDEIESPIVRRASTIGAS